MNKCPVCKLAKCKWVVLKKDVKKLSIEEMERVVHHNLAVVEMLFKDNQGSAYAEERMIGLLNPYCEELEQRKK